MNIDSLGFSSFKSFSLEGVFINDLNKVNIFIGKNNVGKSNVLTFIKYYSDHLNNIRNFPVDIIENQYKRNKQNPCIAVSLKADQYLNTQFEFDDYTKRRLDKYFQIDSVLDIKLDVVTLEIISAGETIKSIDDMDILLKLQSQYSSAGREVIKKAVDDKLKNYAVEELKIFKNLIYIPNYREINKPSIVRKNENVFNGENIIEELFKLRNPDIGEEKDTILKIENFVKDLLNLEHISIEIPHTKDKLILTINDQRLPLDSFGTGIHELVILCSALAIYNNYIVCIEEPEIHLHPTLQRKFLNFLCSTNNTYFITTHSNVFLEGNDYISLYHVNHDGEKSIISHVNSDIKSYEILDDLGYKASDVLQTNGVIWVEGPSDRIYIKKWISLLDDSLKEGIHYSIMFYGGRLLAHLSNNIEFNSDIFIPLLKINRNSIMVIDRDGFSSNAQLNKTKSRINRETKEGNCWITHGREIENYISSRTISNWLQDKYVDCDIKFEQNENVKLEDSIKKANKKIKIDYSRIKAKYNVPIEQDTI